MEDNAEQPGDPIEEKDWAVELPSSTSLNSQGEEYDERIFNGGNLFLIDLEYEDEYYESMERIVNKKCTNCKVGKCQKLKHKRY